MCVSMGAQILQRNKDISASCNQKFVIQQYMPFIQIGNMGIERCQKTTDGRQCLEAHVSKIPVGLNSTRLSYGLRLLGRATLLAVPFPWRLPIEAARLHSQTLLSILGCHKHTHAKITTLVTHSKAVAIDLHAYLYASCHKAVFQRNNTKLNRPSPSLYFSLSRLST